MTKNLISFYLLVELFYLPNAVCRLPLIHIPDNYSTVGDIHYKLFTKPARWIDASKQCNLDGGQLAIDKSHAVHEYLSKHYCCEYWIGVNELASEGTWRFNNGLKVVNSYWAKGEPANDIKHDDCVSMQDGKWHDEACTLAKTFLCQIKEVPNGYTKESDGNYYKFFPDNVNWQTASSKCNENDAHLAIIDSDDIHKYLRKANFSGIYWIGVYHDSTMESTVKWRYNDGRNFPNDKLQHIKAGQSCVAMANSTFDVDLCSVEKAFLCQIKGNNSYLVELMNAKFQVNTYTGPVIMGVIVIVIFLFIVWCICKHRKHRSLPESKEEEEGVRKKPPSSNQQPRYIINMNDTISINHQPISTITKSIIIKGSSAPSNRIPLPQVFSNSGYAPEQGQLPF